MNAENLRTLAHELRADPDRYDQRDFCGTACCIAGRAALLSGREPRANDLTDTHGLMVAASAWLGLTRDEAFRLYGAIGERWPEPFRGRFDRAAYGPEEGPIVEYGQGTDEPPAYVAADLLDALADGKVSL